MAGFIRLSKNITKWRWYRDQNTLCVFLHLILTANTTNGMYEDIDVPRGSLATNRRLLSAELGMTERIVRTALERLSNDQRIVTQTTNRTTIITICDYDSYVMSAPTNDQQNNQQTTNKRNLKKEETEEKEGNLFESLREEKEDKEEKEGRKEDESSTKKVGDIAWRKDKNVYLSLVETTEQELLNDKYAKEEFLRIFPNGDYEKTVMRTADFWKSDRGYEYKIKGRSRTLNMKLTIKNNWDKNVIYVNQQPTTGNTPTINPNPRCVIIDGKEWQL